MDLQLQNLVNALTILPGVGPKSAQRMAFFLLRRPVLEIDAFAKTLVTTRHTVRTCEDCFHVAFSDKCSICVTPNRDGRMLCVVAEPKDVFALERMGEFKGLYHVLGGLVSPIDGINPEMLRIPELLKRLAEGHFQEVVLAISPTIEGEATTLYLTKLLTRSGLKLTRFAYGLPAGADLDYTDALTLHRAFTGRSNLE